MKALVSQSYGPLDELSISELPTPVAAPGKILVRVEAASLNGADTKLPTGEMRDLAPVDHPFVPGIDAAGVVEAVGDDVTRVSIGDKVVLTNGFRSGTLAEYVLVPDGPAVALRPGTLGAEAGAALPLAALTAATAVDAAALEPGDTVLVVGASGGVGSFVVQFANQAGAKVLATARADEEDFLHGLGAEETIDYKNTDTTQEARRLVSGGVDVVIDVANAGPGLAASAGAAKEGGRLVSVLGGPESFERGVTASYIQTRFPEGRLADFAQRAADGRLHVEIGGIYPFTDSAQALRDFAADHFRGKVVVTL